MMYVSRNFKRRIELIVPVFSLRWKSKFLFQGTDAAASKLVRLLYILFGYPPVSFLYMIEKSAVYFAPLK